MVSVPHRIARSCEPGTDDGRPLQCSSVCDAGMLSGPAAIGFISHIANLQAAFLVLVVLLLGVAASGRLLILPANK